MRDLLHQYFNIAFLMGKPQDLPGGQSQLQTGIVLAAVTYVLALVMTGSYGIGRAAIQAFLDLGGTGLVLWVGLSLVGHPARFPQAFGGLCGASMFVNLAALPLFAFRAPAGDAPGSSMVALSDFVLLVWGLSLFAHVIRHSFNVRMITSVLISFTYFIILTIIITAIMPAPDNIEADYLSRLDTMTTAPYDRGNRFDFGWLTLAG